jgi:hypothetical protein
MTGRDEESGFPSYVGSLHVMHPVMTMAKERGSARSVRITLLPDRISIIPFGILRGTFRQKVIFKCEPITINPFTSTFTGREGIMIDGHVGCDGVSQEIYIFPRKASVEEILGAMTDLGFRVDLRPRKPRVFG